MNYDAIYRRLHPKVCPLNPYEPQRELSDLWPLLQQEFKENVDRVAKAIREQN